MMPNNSTRVAFVIFGAFMVGASDYYCSANMIERGIVSAKRNDMLKVDCPHHGHFHLHSQLAFSLYSLPISHAAECPV